MMTFEDSLFTAQPEWSAVWRCLLYLLERQNRMDQQLAELRTDEAALLTALDAAQTREQALIGGLQAQVSSLLQRAQSVAPDLTQDIAAVMQALQDAQNLATSTPSPVVSQPVTGGPDTNFGAIAPAAPVASGQVVQQAPGSDAAADPAAVPPISVDANGQSVPVTDPASGPVPTNLPTPTGFPAATTGSFAPDTTGGTPDATQADAAPEAPATDTSGTTGV